jgi:hypothetical protein
LVLIIFSVTSVRFMGFPGGVEGAGIWTPISKQCPCLHGRIASAG